MAKQDYEHRTEDNTRLIAGLSKEPAVVNEAIFLTHISPEPITDSEGVQASEGLISYNEEFYGLNAITTNLALGQAIDRALNTPFEEIADKHGLSELDHG